MNSPILYRYLIVIPALLTLLNACCMKTMPPPNDCLGKVEVVDGLSETKYDKALLDIAIGNPNQGKLCTGQEFEVVKQLTVYRVWNKSQQTSQNGRWWTFEAPKGPVLNWRSTYAVCAEWGARDILSKCQLKVGTKIVIGPGQSMKCADGTAYPLSPANQIYVPNNLVNDTNYIENCESGAWP